MGSVVIYPALLVPTTTLPLVLPTAGPVEVSKAAPVFNPWTGPQPADTYNGKPILDYDGRPAFAELAILWALHAAGWDGVWIDTYRRVYRTGYWDSPVIRELPPEPTARLQRIHQAAGSRGGAWDVFCWRGAELLFAESKRMGRDSIRPSQVRWLEGALRIGLPLSDFLVVEWSIASSNDPTPSEEDP
jgi:hypothetical protein